MQPKKPILLPKTIAHTSAVYHWPLAGWVEAGEQGGPGGGGALGSLVDSADSWDRAGGAAPEISQSFLPEESPAGGESFVA